MEKNKDAISEVNEKSTFDLNKENNFKKYKGQLEKLYSDDRSVLGALGARKTYASAANIKTRDQLIQAVERALQDPKQAIQLSETLLATNGIYNEILQYYVNMPLYRYTVIPTQIRKKSTTSAVKYADNYEKMIRAVDGISMEVVFPKILLLGMTYGIIYISTDINKTSEAIETFILPNEYCKKGFGTSFGTDEVIFDFQFFTDMRSRLASSGTGSEKITEEEFLEMLPNNLVEKYKLYESDKSLRFQSLDPQTSAAISFSLSGIPPKLFSNYGIVDYEIVKKNEMLRLKNELEKVLVHQIPHTTDGNLIFEIEEALEIHESMARAINGAGLKLLTTFGKTDLLELQSEKTKENKTLLQSYENVFYGAGMNPELFKGDSKEALTASLQKDKAFVFKLLNQVVNFYNLAVNNLYSFGPYEARINLLPITVYDEDEKIKLYRENAGFGIGKLEAIVASGIKQKEIADKHTLEQFLNLDKILVPLQSAHTIPGGDTPAEEEKEKVDVTEEVDTNE